jgi:hypothetical protein
LDLSLASHVGNSTPSGEKPGHGKFQIFNKIQYLFNP